MKHVLLHVFCLYMKFSGIRLRINFTLAFSNLTFAFPELNQPTLLSWVFDELNDCCLQVGD